VPKYNLILNLPGFTIKKVSGYQPLVLDMQFNRLPKCAHCNSRKVRKKGSHLRRVRHESIGHRRTIRQFKAYKLFCNSCRRYGNQQFPGIGKHQRATERLRIQVYHQHTNGVSQKTLSTEFKLGKATVDRWYQHRYHEENKETNKIPYPIVLGIDEHSFI